MARNPRTAQSRPPPQGQFQLQDQTQGPPPIADILQRSIAFDMNDEELDLSTTDNYVDNHVV